MSETRPKPNPLAHRLLIVLAVSLCLFPALTWMFRHLGKDDRAIEVEREQAQKSLVAKAVQLAGDCEAVRDEPANRTQQVIIWNLDSKSEDSATSLMGESTAFKNDGSPVTVFLISPKKSTQVGHYDVSGAPALRIWIDACAIRFQSLESKGTPISVGSVVSLDPRNARPVSQAAELGDTAQPLAHWIWSLPVFDSSPNSKIASGPGPDAITAADKAVQADDLLTLKPLLASEPRLIFAHDSDGWTLLHWAASVGATKTAKFLLSGREHLDGASEKQSPLQHLSRWDVDAREKKGWTPLHVAAHHGQSEMAKLLIDAGADVNARTFDGDTPLDLASTGGQDARHDHVSELLRSYGGQNSKHNSKARDSF